MNEPNQLLPRKSPRQQRSEKRVEAIVSAYLRLLERGEARISTNSIAKEAGVPVSSLYQYFPNKEAIAFSIYDKWASEALELLRRRSIDAESAGDVLDFLADERGDLFGDITNARIVLRLGPVMDSTPELKQAKRAFLEEVTAIIADILRKLGSTWNEAELASLVSLLTELSTTTFRHMARQAPEAAARTYGYWRLGARAMLVNCIGSSKVS